MAHNNGYAEQIAAAKKSLESWPEWMKVNAAFHGSDVSKASRASANYEKENKAKCKRDD